MNKGLAITGVLSLVGLSLLGSNLAAKKNAAEKLNISFKKFQITKASFTEGIMFKVFLSIINPTPTQLSFTTPFIQIFLKNEDNSLSPIASSDKGDSPILLKGRENTEIFIELRLPLIQALKLPKLLSYLVKQFLDKSAKKTKKIIVEYSTKAEGMNISDKMEVLI